MINKGGVVPIQAQGKSTDTEGVGLGKAHEPEQRDDEFDEYRKRMMLSYKFRPNPLNNPRRAYY